MMISRTLHARRCARSALSQARYKHTVSVAKTAVRLARRYGADVKKARRAGYWHDIAKELPAAEQLQILYGTAIINSIDFGRAPQVMHAFSGAVLAKNLGEKDDDVISAVRYHTTARPDMTLLEKVVFVADAISPDRSYEQTEKYRALARRSLDGAVTEILRDTVTQLEAQGKYIVPLSRRAYEFYNKEIAE